MAEVPAAASLDPFLTWGGRIVARVAPEVETRLVRLRSSVWHTPVSQATAIMGLRAAQLLGVEDAFGQLAPGAPAIGQERRAALSRWPTSPAFSNEERACLELAEQFVIDVAGVTRSQRAAAARHVGNDHLLTLVIALFVVDYELRCGLALDRLFPPIDPSRPGPLADPERSAALPPPAAAEAGNDVLMAELDDVLRAVARLDRLDPVTTELVRLRGARHHNCRLCRSIRSGAAVRAAGGEMWFEQVDAYESSDLADAQKVALRLADAVLGQPAEIDASLITALRSHFDDAQIVELVLDIFRNSSQKVAVALDADQPHVASGTELFDLTPEGSVVFSG